MPTKLNDPLPTKLYSSWENFILDPGSIYIFGTSVEARSVHPEQWEAKAKQVEFVRVWSEEAGTVPFSSCRIEYENKDEVLQLRAGDTLAQFIGDIPGDSIYLDITGLSHGVWAPLLRASIITHKPLQVVYVEPVSYSFSRTPTEAEIFDLSTEIRDIFPLPGFSSLTEPEREDEVVFVPLLGFEGHRLAYILENVQPPMRTTIPIVGVPGFRMEYPFHTYLGNRNILMKNNLFTRVKYAIANSASDVFYQLSEIAAEYPKYLMKIAPIGTKPHALGAILFALCAERPVELVYDHPIRKAKRTTGSANILVYNVICIFDKYDENR